MTGLSRETGAALAAHPGVDKVAFTGSTATGRAVARAAAEQPQPRSRWSWAASRRRWCSPTPTSAAAANGVVAGVFAATGQTCMAGSRLIVHARRARRAGPAGRRPGGAGSGSATRPTRRPRWARWPTGRSTRRCSATSTPRRAEGATVAYGGAADASSAAVRPADRAHRRDARRRRSSARRSSGRCSPRHVHATEDEAVKLANDTPYGLAGAVWTKDVHRAHRVAGRIRAGTVWINAYRVVAPNVPFGGFGARGIGRENGLARGRRVPPRTRRSGSS